MQEGWRVSSAFIVDFGGTIADNHLKKMKGVPIC